MTYPSLTSRRHRHEAAVQLRLARIPLAYVRRKAPESAPGDTVARQVHRAMRAETRATLAGMRRMLHALFD